MKLKYQILEKEDESALTVEEVKNFLRLSHDYDDSLVKDLIQAATDYAENFTGKFINTRIVKCLVFQADKEIHIKYAPLNKVLSVEKIVKDQLKDISDSFGEIDLNEALLEVNPIYHGQDIIIKFSCGYKEKVPYAIKMGILKHVSAMYELSEDSLDPVEEVRNLYLPFRSFKI